MFFSSIKRFILAIFITSALSLVSSPVHAADPKHTIRDSAYAAKFVSQSISDPIAIEAGSMKAVVVKFKNVGTATWDAASTKFISAYTVEPRYRDSVFKGANWMASKQTGKIAGVVKPGAVGELTIELKAPEKMGTYKEEFYLASENNSWVKGGYFFLELNVVAKKQNTTSVAPEQSQPEVNNTNTELQAKRILLNKKQIEARGGEQVPVIIAVQNTGTATWNSYALKTKIGSGVIIASDDVVTGATLVEKQTAIAQWGIAREEVIMTMPKKKGMYTLKIMVSANGVELPQEIGTISVTVTENAEHVDESTSDSTFQLRTRLEQEPRIRVGVWKDPTNGVKFMSEEDDYYVFDGGVLMGTLHRGVEATMDYSGGMYSFVADGITFTTSAFVRLEPVTSIRAIYKLTNYERLVSWKGPYNFNAYRGAMEYRATQSGEGVYVIEELLFEDYVAGIAETSDGSPIEYIKALLTAARTYAYYIQNHSTKHDTRFFDVVATTGDQLYLGYQSERLMPRVVEAARATRGYMVTYDIDTNPDTVSDIVITPYFANTDGRTRAWTEVWGGAVKPWLVSVAAEFDKRDGKRMAGHGVGMSARDAAIRADELGETFDTILKYYYTGVQIEKVYN